MTETELTLHDYLVILRRRWRLIVLIFAIVVAAGTAFNLTATPQYRSQVEVLVEQQSTFDPFDPISGQRIDERRSLQTEVKFITSTVVSDAVEEQLGIETEITASGSADANIITLTATGVNAEDVAIIANTYATVYIELRRQSAVDEYLDTAGAVQERLTALQSDLADLDDDDPTRIALEAQAQTYTDALESLSLGADLSGGFNRQIISAAEVPPSAFSPAVTRNTALAAVLGLILGVGAALLRDSLDDAIRDKNDLESITNGLPTLALVPTVESWGDRSEARIISVDDPTSDTSEAYRTLRTSLQFMAISRDMKVIMLTSAQPGEGKSTTSANLAVSLARTGKRVVIMDCDLRKPRLHEFFQAEQHPGVTNILLGEILAQHALVRVIDPTLKLALAPAGQVAPNPSEALAGFVTRDLIDQLREAADVVIIDSPPVIPVADPLVLADKVDAVILVTQSKVGQKKDVARALELLDQVNAPVVGTVLNNAARNLIYGYGGRYGYKDHRNRHKAKDLLPDREGVAAADLSRVFDQADKDKLDARGPAKDEATSGNGSAPSTQGTDLDEVTTVASDPKTPSGNSHAAPPPPNDPDKVRTSRNSDVLNPPRSDPKPRRWFSKN